MADTDFIEDVQRDDNVGEDTKERLIRWATRVIARELFLDDQSRDTYSRTVNNLYISQCYSCNAFALWHADSLMFPKSKFEIEPNEDLPVEIKADFNEAAFILDLSARGAAALLRLALQKLLKHLGETGENINGDIGSLVQKGLDVRIQQALDLVRVIGNNAVHPGSIDMRDNRDTAVRLFSLINMIAYDRITHPREIDALYQTHLTPSQKQAIAARDKK